MAAPAPPKADRSSTSSAASRAEVFAGTWRRSPSAPAWWLDRKRAAYARFEALAAAEPHRRGLALQQHLGRHPRRLRARGGRRRPRPAAQPLAVDGRRHRSSFPDGRLAGARRRLRRARRQGRRRLDPLRGARRAPRAPEGALHGPAAEARLGQVRRAPRRPSSSDGAFIHVPRGRRGRRSRSSSSTPPPAPARPSSRTRSSSPRTTRKVTRRRLLRLAPTSRRQFACGANDLYAGHGAQLTYVAAQNWSRETLSFQFNSTVVRRDARVQSLNLHLGGRQARHESL